MQQKCLIKIQEREYFIIFKVLTSRAKSYGVSSGNYLEIVKTVTARKRSTNHVGNCEDRQFDSSMSGTILILTEILLSFSSSKLLRFESHIFASYAALPYSQTDGTSQRQTPRTLSRTPITPDTPDSLELGIHEVSSDDDEEPKKTRGSTSWSIQEHPVKKAR